MRHIHHAFLILLALVLAPLALTQEEAIPHTFESGDVIEAAKMNENFQAILDLVGADGLPATCDPGDVLGWDGTTWDCFTPATDEPRTETITISGAAFVGLGETQVERDFAAETCLVKDGDTAAAMAPLALPQGSTITNVTYTHAGYSADRYFSIIEIRDPTDVEQHFGLEPAPSPGIETDSVDDSLQIKEGHTYNVLVANAATATTCDDLYLAGVAVTYQLP